ncbi:MAG: DUF4301 family protein [Muribaculaceae bacterium]|nr:DUF4301 family protein [Muribaculaceae bacterium]
MLTNSDINQLEKKGIKADTVKAQLDKFVTGFPFLKLQGAATPGNGVLVLDDDAITRSVERWNRYIADGGEAIKMVPASGAASRMFKSLFAFVDSEEGHPAAGSDVEQVIAGIDKFAFAPELDNVLKELHGLTAKELIAQGREKDVISAIVSQSGLNYGNLPKALLEFHSYADGSRTPLEEQLVEAAQTVASADGNVKIQFTVSPEHREKFLDKLSQIIPALEKRLGVKYDISLSEQKASTDTIAANPDNTPFRENGRLVFRPGGHGALIENLNELKSPVVFIKNIDNVVPDSQRDDTVRYKKVIGGLLLMVRDRINGYLEKLESGRYTIENLREMIIFMHDTLNIRHEHMKLMDDSELALYLKKKFHRPIRVCGVVRNTGEPGGGPYITYDADGSTSPQILESTQIDMNNSEYVDMMKHATHFNPVDLVCSLYDADGRKFDLTKHVDHNTGFISSKSLHGHSLKALELPGLWNGAMSDWNTIFVEVPASTFNPVKTVNDLLRPVHQA